MNKGKALAILSTAVSIAVLAVIYLTRGESYDHLLKFGEIGYCNQSDDLITEVKKQGYHQSAPLQFSHRSRMITTTWSDGNTILVIEDDMLQGDHEDTACITQKYIESGTIIRM